MKWQTLKRIFASLRTSKPSPVPYVEVEAREAVSATPHPLPARVRCRDRHLGLNVKLRLRQWEYETLSDLAGCRGVAPFLNKLASQITTCDRGYAYVSLVSGSAAEPPTVERTRPYQFRVDPNLLRDDDEVPFEVSPLGRIASRNFESLAHLLTRFLHLRLGGEISFVSGYVTDDQRAEIVARYDGRVEFLD